MRRMRRGQLLVLALLLLHLCTFALGGLFVVEDAENGNELVESAPIAGPEDIPYFCEILMSEKCEADGDVNQDLTLNVLDS